jgi:tRNA (cytidine56-2'-O)-methyltransferase|tara:strand:- start:234 stop:464 length:231 start_codon:yes stop_codon:yes gene_type:complete
MVVIVGGAKVPGDVYKYSQYNLSVGNQPHSEVAALALFLDAWHGESGSERSFDDARLIIQPTASGKRVLDLDREEE